MRARDFVRRDDELRRVTERRRAPEPPAAILALQRGVGNAAVARALLQRDDLHTLGSVTLDLAGGDPVLAEVFVGLKDRWSYPQLRALLADWTRDQIREIVAGCQDGLRDAERAEMTLQFVHNAGGTFELVRYAEQKRPATNADYLDLLRFLMGARTALPAAKPGDWRLDVLAKHAKDLAQDEARFKPALQLFAAADDQASAARMIDALAAFNWKLGPLQAALDNALAVAKEARADENKALDAEKTKRRQEALEATYEAALQKLDRKDRKAIQDKTTRETPYQNLKAKQAELAKPAQQAVTEDIESRRSALPPLNTTEPFTARRDQWLDYYDAVAHDPRAQTALNLAGGDFAFAGLILNAARADANVATFVFTAKPELKILKAAFALPAAELSALLALVPTEVAKYAVKPSWLSLLRALNVGNVAAPRIVAVTPKLGSLDAYLQVPTEVTAFVTLLNHYDMAQVDALQLAMHPADKADAGKLAALEAVRPHAAGYADVLECASTTAKVKCTAAELQAAMAGLGVGLDATQLLAPVYQRVATRHARIGAFKGWIHDVAALVAQNECTVTFGPVEPLPGNPHNPTLEVTATVAGRVNNTFVVHRHPGVGQAGVGAANQSGLHTKPVRGNLQTEREPVENLSKRLKDLIKATGI
jgi:hypothetical protein